MINQPNFPIFTPENEARALAEIERRQRELDITNVDHILLWLEAWKSHAGSGYLACRIADAYEEAITQARRKALEEAAEVAWMEAVAALHDEDDGAPFAHLHRETAGTIHKAIRALIEKEGQS